MVGRNLIGIIKEKDIDIKTLARKTGIRQSTIYYWINSDFQPRLDTVEKVSDALGLTPDEEYELIHGHKYEDRYDICHAGYSEEQMGREK